MRPIKFRGRDLDSGEYVFFNLEDILLDVAGSYSEYVGLHNIDPDSVAQLVGYDANGKEVYEGDTVLRYDSEEEFIEAPENGVLREVILYTQVNPDLEDYYCLVKEADQ